ncbi:AAA family ATPase [Sporosarcina soli]|uniref:AAA family ATPase n=1 Tax=Sporosarcina soli TaxID=334736 RepID=A0ABW0TR46_9BACL
MKIEKLVIYGFGKHENITLDVGPGINVLYGQNEAGKTTIQQFILHILFGFPQKNSALLRYEPKSGGKYGGQVHIYDKEFGKCIVERVRGKSAGDVNVHFEDGRKGGEADLDRLLRQYDRASFESIFSFSLLQLQGFEKMDEEELSRTLLASGTTGVDTLLQLEKKLEKELGDLFKKSGKNPQMNVKMAELRELELELKKEQEKIADYAPAVERIRQIDERLQHLREQQKEMEQQAQQFQLMRQLLPLHEKRQTIKPRLAAISVDTFPTDGIRRYEKLAGRRIEAETALHRTEDELSKLLADMPEQPVDDRLTEIDLLLAKESEWHRWQTAAVSAEEDVRKQTDLKRQLLEGIGMLEDEENVLLQADVSLQKEEQLYELMNRLAGSDAQIGYLNRQLVQLENEKADQEQDRLVLERSAPSQEEVQRVHRWPARRQQLAEAKAYVAIGTGQQETPSRTFLLLGALLAILFGTLGFILKEWLFVVAALLFVGMGFFIQQKNGRASADETKLREMEKIIASYDGHEEQMEELAERVARYNREVEVLQEGLLALERKQQRLEAERDHTYFERQQIESELSAFLRRYGFKELPSTGIIPELFRMIREVQGVERDRKAAIEQLETMRKNMAGRVKDVENVLHKSIPEEALYELLRREFIDLKEKVEAFRTINRTIVTKKASLNELTGLVAGLTDKMQALFKEVGAETEEAFYSAHAMYQESVLLKGQLLDLDAQLAVHGPLELPAGETDASLQKQGKAIGETLTLLDAEQHTLIQEKATLVSRTEQLLSDESYARTYQLFEMKKTELAELAKKWAERKALSEAIKQTMRELKEKKLPAVLEEAEELFNELTGGRYISLIVTEQGRFEVLSTNGMRYPIMELSQATKEQAYISLRLALAASVNDSAPFPILMDDPFVHFDGTRLSRMIELLERYQSKHQFMYFTCHDGMTEKWQQATILQVSELGSRQGANVI